MLIRIINRKTGAERRVKADIVDFDHINWLITINGKIETFKRKDFEVQINE